MLESICAGFNMLFPDTVRPNRNLNPGRCCPKDLRGLGLMVGLEFDALQGSGVSTAVAQACLRRGMILMVCSSYETVRFIPPLNVSEAEMDEGLEIFEDALKEVFL